MPGIASIYKPQAADGKKLQVFYTSPNNQLATQHHDEGNANDNPEALTSGIPGSILDKSQVASSMLRGKHIVAGFTKTKSAAGYDDEYHSVSVVSPESLSIDKTNKNNLTIASSTSGDDAWIYYFKGRPGDLVLVEAHVNSGRVREIADTVQINEDSSLAAYYDPETDQRSVIIQGASDPTLYEYSADGEGETAQLKYTYDAQLGTSLAVIWVEGTVYLYYTKQNQELRVVTKQYGRSWGSPQHVMGTRVDGSSQLTAVAARNGNHLFYVARGDPQSKISHVIHKR
ncbi:hypothetical protein F52700_2817 [Fusarium sp. NRRL 52700]|nr:hypothetical protein F52700_2817 [Fusarium sp. NRRL 52700]